MHLIQLRCTVSIWQNKLHLKILHFYPFHLSINWIMKMSSFLKIKRNRSHYWPDIIEDDIATSHYSMLIFPEPDPEFSICLLGCFSFLVGSSSFCYNGWSCVIWLLANRSMQYYTLQTQNGSASITDFEDSRHVVKLNYWNVTKHIFGQVKS